MEKSLLLKAELREKFGKKNTKQLRKQGMIPATVYGHKKESVSISLNAHETVKGLHHGSRLVDLEIAGKKETVLFKDLQYDYLGRDIIHVDFIRVDASETVKVMVPIEIKGKAKGKTEGGIIEEHLDRIEIECKVTDIPESIEVSVKELEVGSSIHAGDVELGEGIKLITGADVLLITCHLVAAAKSAEEMAAEEEGEGAAMPEVIGEKKEEGSEEESK